MSHREGRDSDGRRRHSRWSDREPSPKKARRDGKPATERTYTSSRHLDNVDTSDRDKKQHRRLQDASSLEVAPEPVKTVQPDTIGKDLDKVDELPDVTKHSSDVTKHSSDVMEVPQSQSYIQHDERGSAGQGGRSFGRKSSGQGRWSDPKEQYSGRARDRREAHELQRHYDRSRSSADDKKVWRHDRFYELEAEAPPPRKRPAFSEKKMPAELDSVQSVEVSEPARTIPYDQPVLGGTRWEERGVYHSSGLDKFDRPIIGADERTWRKGNGPLDRAETQRPSYRSRERFRGGFMGGRDRTDGRYSERSAHRSGDVQVDKWKHDMFDEANRSPSPKNEEEQIAKVEALLAL